MCAMRAEPADPRPPAPAATPLSPGAQAILDTLLTQLEPRVEMLAATVATRVREQVGGYQAATARPGLDYDDAVRRITGIALRVLRDGAPPCPEELLGLRAIGASRAAQSLSLEAINAGLRLGVWLGWNDILAHVRDLPLAEDNVAVLGALATRLFGFSDQVAAALAAGHGENREVSRDRELQRVELVGRLLDGDFASDDEMIRRAAGFGYDLTSPHGLLLLAAADRSAVRGVAVALRRALPGAIGVAQRGAPPGHAVVLVPSASAMAWREVLARARDVAAARGVSAVWAPPVARPGRIAAAYAEAARCVPMLAAVYRRPRVVEADDLLAHRALRGGAEDRRRFVERTLGGVLALPPRHGDPLLDTLEGLIEHAGNVEATRHALGVHDKTIRYRIRRVRELTGLCPLRDRGRLELALMLQRLEAVEA